MHHIIREQPRLSVTHEYYLKGLFTFTVYSPLSHKEMYGHLREDTKVPLGNIPHILHLFCGVNQQQVTTVQWIRFISRGGGEPKKPNVDMNQLLCKLSSHTAGSWSRMGTASCANTARHATHIIGCTGISWRWKKIWSARYRKKIPFLQINCISSRWKAGEWPLGKRHKYPREKDHQPFKKIQWIWLRGCTIRLRSSWQMLSGWYIYHILHCDKNPDVYTLRT